MKRQRTPEETTRLLTFLDEWIEERRSQNTFAIGIGLRDQATVKARIEAREVYTQLLDDLKKLRLAVERGEFM